ncbi:MAG: protein adenylyltransferase SelO family protein, partial [Burkholderiales bacterium]
GFIHGVMNTDNMTISGETIDYGPCAFVEAYDPRTVFSSIDTQGRYAFGNQPGIAQWNLARFAETLLPLLHESSDTAVEIASEIINGFPARYQEHALAAYRAKLGLGEPFDSAGDQALIDDFLKLLHQHGVDYTLGFRRLANAAAGDDTPLRTLFGNGDGDAAATLDDWLSRWRARAAAQTLSGERRATLMAHANPIYIARNHLVEAALAAAVADDDLTRFERLLAVLQAPFDERAADADHAQPAPSQVTAAYRTFCGT